MARIVLLPFGVKFVRQPLHFWGGRPVNIIEDVSDASKQDHRQYPIQAPFDLPWLILQYISNVDNILKNYARCSHHRHVRLAHMLDFLGYQGSV